MTNLKDYYRSLRAADWLYRYSDSREDFGRGASQIKKLAIIAEESPAHADMFKAMHKSGEDGSPWPEPESFGVDGVDSATKPLAAPQMVA